MPQAVRIPTRDPCYPHGVGGREKLAALIDRCEADGRIDAATRTEGDRLAIAQGGELALRWHIAVLRAVMAAPPDADAVRELYGELVDQYRDDPASLAQLRALGGEIKKRESDGTLPSTMVARSDRRKR